MTTEHNPLLLLRTRRFLPLFLTQFLGAFNDNVLKQGLMLLVTFQGGAFLGLPPAITVTVANGLFVLPMFLFSASAGQVADAFDKAVLTRWIKTVEIGIAGVAFWGFWVHSVPVLLAALFLMGLHSTFFGPIKYSILPQHLKPEEVVGGNAWVESATFVAILLGSIVGGVLISLPAGAQWTGGACVLFAVLGWIAARPIPTAPPLARVKMNWNPFSEIARNLKIASGNRAVFLAMIGISWFWFYGLLLQSQLPAYVSTVLGGEEALSTFLSAIFIVGIALGSLAAERASGGKVELGLVPMGSLGLTLFGIDLFLASPAHPAHGIGIAAFLAQPGSWRIIADFALLGAFGGLYTIPLYVMIQTRCPGEYRSRIVAANNVLNAAFMVASALLTIVGLGKGLSIPQLFLIGALMNLAVALFIYKQVPEFLQRLVVWLLVHTVYRVRGEGHAHIPAEGPALLICNHVSYMDPLIIMAESRRPVRFVMDHRIFAKPFMRFVFKEARAIPIAPAKEDPAMLDRAYDEVALALSRGELVAIFPEGRITDTGELYPFRGGVNKIVERTPVPVIPLAISGLWGSFFSRKDGPAMTRPLRRGLFNRIDLAVGPAVAPQAATPELLQAEVARLRTRP
ncbi:MFS transporter [Niveibacterium sp. SC-1]|uniref:MFS transporter n=1 Tax=Niveibacterium sp. SC-1 TaxID=3135646 RepID=UPI00311FEA90